MIDFKAANYLFLFLLLIFFGCKDSVPYFIDIEHSQINTIKGKEITSSEMEEFGSKLVELIKNSQEDSLTDLIDFERYMFRVIDKCEIDPKYIRQVESFIEGHFNLFFSEIIKKQKPKQDSVLYTKWKSLDGNHSIVISHKIGSMVDFYEFDLFKFDDTIKIVDFMKYSDGFKDTDFVVYFFKNRNKTSASSIENFKYATQYNVKGIAEMAQKNEEKAAEHFKWVDKNYGDEFIEIRRRLMNFEVFPKEKKVSILEAFINKYGEKSEVGIYHQIWLKKINDEGVDENLKNKLINMVGESEMLFNYLN